MSSCWLCSLTFLSFVSQIVCIQNGTQTTSAIRLRTFGSVYHRWIGRSGYTVTGGCRDTLPTNAAQRSKPATGLHLFQPGGRAQRRHAGSRSPHRLMWSSSTASCVRRPTPWPAAPPRPRAACSWRRPSFRPLAPAAPSWPRRCSPELWHCRLVTAPGDGAGFTPPPPLQRLRMAAAVARGVGLPWSARRHGGAGFGLAITYSREGVTVELSVDQRCSRSSPEEVHRTLVYYTLVDLPLAEQALWVCWTDG